MCACNKTYIMHFRSSIGDGRQGWETEINTFHERVSDGQPL